MATSTDQLVTFIVGRGLAVPAVFMLELHKPLRGLVAALGVGLAPILRALVPRHLHEELERIMSSEEALEGFIRAIETEARQQR